MSTSTPTVLLAGDAMQRTLRRMALSIVERTGKRAQDLCLIGVRRVSALDGRAIAPDPLLDRLPISSSW